MPSRSIRSALVASMGTRPAVASSSSMVSLNETFASRPHVLHFSFTCIWSAIAFDPIAVRQQKLHDDLVADTDDVVFQGLGNRIANVGQLLATATGHGPFGVALQMHVEVQLLVAHDQLGLAHRTNPSGEKCTQPSLS